MRAKWLFSHLSVPCQENILSEASLFPKDGHWASDLHVTDEVATSHYHDLLCLTEVGNVTLVVDASCIVPGACTIPHAPGDQSQLGLKSVDSSISLREIALDQRCEPSAVDFLPNEISVKRQIPEVCMVTGYQS